MYLCVHKETGKEYAVKAIDRVKVGDKTEMLQTEIDIMRRVQHENIITMIDLYDEDQFIFLVIELYVQGATRRAIGQVADVVARWVSESNCSVMGCMKRT